MKPSCFDLNDSKIKEGLEALANEVPVPDVTAAFEKHKRRREERGRFHGVAVVAAILMFFIVVATSGPTQAFKGFVMETTSRMLTETSQLFQRSRESGVEVTDVLEIKEFDSLSELQNEQSINNLLPNGLGESDFTSAKVVYNSGVFSDFMLEFMYFETPLLFEVRVVTTYARSIDIEDFEVQTLNVEGVEVMTLDSVVHGWSFY